MPILMITGNRRRLLNLVNEHITKSKWLSLSMTAISIVILQAVKWIPLTLPMSIRQSKDAALVLTSRVNWVAIGKVASRILWSLPIRLLRCLSLVVVIGLPLWIQEDWTLTQHLIPCHMVIRLHGIPIQLFKTFSEIHFFESPLDHNN